MLNAKEDLIEKEDELKENPQSETLKSVVAGKRKEVEVLQQSFQKIMGNSEVKIIEQYFKKYNFCETC